MAQTVQNLFAFRLRVQGTEVAEVAEERVVLRVSRLSLIARSAEVREEAAGAVGLSITKLYCVETKTIVLECCKRVMAAGVEWRKMVER